MKQIRKKLTPSVDPKLLDNVCALFTRGAPNAAKGHSSNENFKAYWRYGNHHSCDEFQDFFKKVMVKDSKRGNVILVDPAVLYFLQNLHLTPQAMVDVNNPWKDERPVFDSSHRPEIWCHAINDWIDKATEGEVYFPGLFIRFLI